jgi:hypothetical protein
VFNKKVDEIENNVLENKLLSSVSEIETVNELSLSSPKEEFLFPVDSNSPQENNLDKCIKNEENPMLLIEKLENQNDSTIFGKPPSDFSSYPQKTQIFPQANVFSSSFPIFHANPPISGEAAPLITPVNEPPVASNFFFSNKYQSDIDTETPPYIRASLRPYQVFLFPFIFLS